MRYIKFLLLLVMSVFISCTTTNEIQDNSVFVMIYDYDNTPVKEVKIFLDEKLIGTTDVNGRFVFEVKDLQEHKVYLYKDNYESINDSFIYETSLVLYYKLGNSEQYLKMAEEKFDERKLDNALLLIEKALEIDGTRQDALFLKAVILNKLSRFEESNQVLNNIKITERNKNIMEEMKKVNDQRNSQ